jgi:hypothetical protein
VRYEVRPAPAHPRASDIGGAFVNAWAVAESRPAARRQSEAFLTAEHWLVVDYLGISVVAPAECPPSDLGLFWQVQVDREVYVFHLFPADLGPTRR